MNLKNAASLLDAVELSTWHTPATQYPLIQVGNARIARANYTKGIYNLHNARAGAEFFVATKPLPITELKIGRHTWMIDDPTHWWMIERIAKKLHGRVLIGGLGLGLIVHALAHNPAVESIVLVERDADVIALMTPNVPEEKLTIVEADFYEYIKDSPQFDSAFVDLWVTKNAEETRNVFYSQVIPLAVEVLNKTGAPMHALGFTEDRPVIDEIVGN